MSAPRRTLPPLGPSDAAREEAVAALRAVFVAGCLDLSAFEARLDAVLRADSDEQFRAATHDLLLTPGSDRPRSARRFWVAIAAAAATLGLIAASFVGTDRLPDVIAELARKVRPDKEALAKARLLDWADREHWSSPCAASRAALQSAQGRPKADRAPADRLVDLIPPAPWPGATISGGGVLAGYRTLYPPPLGAAVLTHDASRAYWRAYSRGGNSTGATIEVFEFRDAATAQAARRDYFNGAVCAFGDEPVEITGTPGVLATRRMNEVTATWTDGPHLLRVLAAATAPDTAAAATESVRAVLTAAAATRPSAP